MRRFSWLRLLRTSIFQTQVDLCIDCLGKIAQCVDFPGLVHFMYRFSRTRSLHASTFLAPITQCADVPDTEYSTRPFFYSDSSMDQFIWSNRSMRWFLWRTYVKFSQSDRFVRRLSWQDRTMRRLIYFRSLHMSISLVSIAQCAACPGPDRAMYRIFRLERSMRRLCWSRSLHASNFLNLIISNENRKSEKTEITEKDLKNSFSQSLDTHKNFWYSTPSIFHIIVNGTVRICGNAWIEHPALIRHNAINVRESCRTHRYTLNHLFNSHRRRWCRHHLTLNSSMKSFSSGISLGTRIRMWISFDSSAILPYEIYSPDSMTSARRLNDYDLASHDNKVRKNTLRILFNENKKNLYKEKMMNPILYS